MQHDDRGGTGVHMAKPESQCHMQVLFNPVTAVHAALSVKMDP